MCHDDHGLSRRVGKSHLVEERPSVQRAPRSTAHECAAVREPPGTRGDSADVPRCTLPGRRQHCPACRDGVQDRIRHFPGGSLWCPRSSAEDARDHCRLLHNVRHAVSIRGRMEVAGRLGARTGDRSQPLREPTAVWRRQQRRPHGTLARQGFPSARRSGSLAPHAQVLRPEQLSIRGDRGRIRPDGLGPCLEAPLGRQLQLLGCRKRPQDVSGLPAVGLRLGPVVARAAQRGKRAACTGVHRELSHRAAESRALRSLQSAIPLQRR